MGLVHSLNQNQGLFMIALTFVYVLATIVIARQGQRSLTVAIDLERSRSRPYVFFNIASSVVKGTTYASIKNHGLTAAYNVKVTIQPKLVRLHDGKELESALTSENIPYLPPGARLTDIIDSSPEFHRKYPEPIFNGIVEYETQESRKYRESFHVDLTFLKKRIYQRGK
jgi:hypothetical protein